MKIRDRVPNVYDLHHVCDHGTAAELSIAVVIATHNRPQLLARRSLASIADQTRPPDLLIIVDDSDTGIRHSNRAVAAKFKAGGIKTVYLENCRTRGAAGSWNTALSHLQATVPSTFVAILDDDDSWEPEYLHQCEKAVSERNSDMVASGITYHESATLEGRLLDPPRPAGNKGLANSQYWHPRLQHVRQASQAAGSRRLRRGPSQHH